ncbi:MAG TPA: Crp/Fnr family transcriptional regulator [Anaerolineales bacterium]|nr:Crp/Fnr family transcriptional regulator [Anaerolineales bacterium]
MPRPKSPVRLEWLDPAVCSLDYRLKIIGRLPFFRHLSSGAILEINRLFEDRDITAEQAIYFEGDPANYLYLVATGKVKLMRHAASGREVLLDILRGGEYFGNLAVLSGQGYSETAIAQTDCCILQISAQNFEQVLNRHPDVTMKVLKAVGQRLEESQEIVKQLSVYTVEQRIAAALVRLAQKLGEPKQEGVLIQLPFSRQDLAAMTGTTVETVSRTMSRFSGEGLISTGRKWVSINDLSGLETIAKEGAVN